MERPRKGQTVYLDADLLAWIEENVPRKISVSAFVNQAVRHYVEGQARPSATRKKIS